MASDEEMDESYAGDEEVEEAQRGGTEENSLESDEEKRVEDDDEDAEVEDGRKKKKGKKRKARSESKKEKKRKKKKKADSAEESDYGGGEDEGGDSDYGRKSRKRGRDSGAKHSQASTPQPAAQENSGMPTVEEVCQTFGLNDVHIEYTDADFQNLTTYKLFQQHVRPLLAKDNPKVPTGKMMMLVAAKWRDFCNLNPNQQAESDGVSEEPDYMPKPSRSRSKSSVATEEALEEDEEDLEEKEEKRGRKGRRSSKKGNSKKNTPVSTTKVPTLKIKLGKRKQASSVSIGVVLWLISLH